MRELTPRDKFVVIASDGVFEFLPSQAVVEMVSKFNDPLEAAVHVASESYRLWLQARSVARACAHARDCPSEPCRRQCLRVGQRVAPLPRLPPRMGLPSVLAIARAVHRCSTKCARTTSRSSSSCWRGSRTRRRRPRRARRPRTTSSRSCRPRQGSRSLRTTQATRLRRIDRSARAHTDACTHARAHARGQ